MSDSDREELSSSRSQALTIRDLVNSAAAGVGATIVTHPFDTWAMHRQTGRQLPTRPMAFFRGLGPACLQAAAIYGVLIGGFELMHSSWGWSVFAASAASALPESVVRGPLEAMKSIQQAGVTGMGRQQYISAFFKGTLGTLMREVPGNTTYFCTYMWVRSKDAHPWVAGALTGAVYTIVGQPIESMRAQIVTGAKVQPTLRGIGPYMVRNILVVAFTQLFYEGFAGRPLGTRSDT